MKLLIILATALSIMPPTPVVKKAVKPIVVMRSPKDAAAQAVVVPPPKTATISFYYDPDWLSSTKFHLKSRATPLSGAWTTNQTFTSTSNHIRLKVPVNKPQEYFTVDAVWR